MRRLERSATSANSLALWAGSGADCVAGMSLVLSVANHAVGADRTLQAPIEMEEVEVGHRLAHGEEKLVRVELASKKRIEHARRRFGSIAGFMQLGEAQAVMLPELRDSLAQAPERQAVRGQREGRRGQSGVAGYRVEEERERVSLRLVRPNA